MTASDTIRVQIPIVIEVSRQAWDDEFATGTSAKDVSDDVRTYVLTSIQSLVGVTDTDANVTIKR